MLKGGADPNVLGPKSKPEEGRSCFMYNVAIKSFENQKVQLEADKIEYVCIIFTLN